MGPQNRPLEHLAQDLNVSDVFLGGTVFWKNVTRSGLPEGSPGWPRVVDGAVTSRGNPPKVLQFNHIP